MIKRFLALPIFLAFVTSGAQACSCGGPRLEPCKGLSATDVIFVGTVVHITNPPPTDMSNPGSGESTYRFHVDEKIAGNLDPEIDIYSGRGGGDCSYHFEQGEEYIVFPYKISDGHLFATICSPTRPVNLAAALLPELRAMRDHQRVASLYGFLRSAEQPYTSVTDDGVGEPLANTRVELHSDDHVFVSKTDPNGAYAFYGVSGGEYRIMADLPANLEIAQAILADPPPPLALPENACYEYDIWALPTGRIRGRVLGKGGNLCLMRLWNYSAVISIRRRK
jgi:hypothetical protein